MEWTKKRTAGALIRGIREVVKALEPNAGKTLSMKYVGRSYVFRDNGATCCIFGHIVERAGLKSRFKSFRVKGTKEPLWSSNVDTIAHLLNVGIFDLDMQLSSLLDDLQIANDVPQFKEDRIKKIKEVLPALVTALKEIQ